MKVDIVKYGESDYGDCDVAKVSGGVGVKMGP